MTFINMFRAKSDLSRLVKAIEEGREREVIIARRGRPAAKLVAVDAQAGGPRIGVAAGKFTVPDNIDVDNRAIARLFGSTRA